jgi:hypothetical protein
VALTPYADRPEVLAAAEQDLERNPGDWASTAAFEAQLKAVVARIDGLQVPPATSPAAALPRETIEDLPVPERRARPVSHVAEPLPDCPVEAILELVDQLTTEGQVHRVEQAVRARAAALGLKPRRF